MKQFNILSLTVRDGKDFHPYLRGTERLSVPTCGGRKGFPSLPVGDGKAFRPPKVRMERKIQRFSLINKNSQSFSMKFLIISHNQLNKASMMIRRID